ncbi:Sec-independent protein translocase subunit TatA/TatB [Rickettsiales endosymbiont of Stachyamoeba lipophora]|uniref:Sec-independent protein translocase subunit TatA/TatB n=1 Tax=Rickettsiales endosymbiont of Stachyamoeba lipophora TaxID=2486578 RepID=UPI000F64ABEC|nr:hypothetical protein [Rickettsiales endosymbiont of Stachyamoeba lipophora]AZL15387.1 hypothetical protein EF513_02295 [Rickettsiales endosymbiont of Stachyamoeba lipophora]
MLPVSWPEFLVIIVVSICLLGKKEIPEVVNFIKSVVGKFNTTKSKAYNLYAQLTRELEIDKINQELTTYIIGDDGKEYQCYNLEVLKPDIIASKDINNIPKSNNSQE